ENPATHEQGTDRPGRLSDGPVRAAAAGGEGFPQRSGIAQTDWHQLEEARFADELAEMLYKRAHAGEFSRIVLVAAPRVLGDLRERLHQVVTDKVVGEVPKTLT